MITTFPEKFGLAQVLSDTRRFLYLHGRQSLQTVTANIPRLTLTMLTNIAIEDTFSETDLFMID